MPSGACQGLVQLAPLLFFAEFTCNLQRGKWLCCNLHYLLSEVSCHWSSLAGTSTCPAATSTCPATLLNKGEFHCEDSAHNGTPWAGQVRILFCLPDCRFLPNSPETYNGASGYVARCMAISSTCYYQQGACKRQAKAATCCEVWTCFLIDASVSRCPYKYWTESILVKVTA